MVEYDYFYTSGTGVFQLQASGARGGSTFGFLVVQSSGNASGGSFSVMDGSSGLWLVASGARFIADNPVVFVSSATPPTPQRLEYGVQLDSGLILIISGGAANTIRIHVGYTRVIGTGA